MLRFLDAAADAAESTPTGNNLPMTIIFIVIIVGMIGLLIWQTVSGKKKQKEARNMVDSLKVGDRVKTIGGVCGFVAEINNAENTFVLETGLDGNKSYVKFDKGAIYQTAPAQGSAVAAEEKTEEKQEEPADKE
ncbi:MAG: preprotein translocase subunit YajC [Clostridia bacterium]|nr:preprotein translocase subunit YajC [Clostridia bacterium]